MAKDKKDYLWYLVPIIILGIPIWMLLPFGQRTMRSWAVSNPSSGMAKVWMDLAIFSHKTTLQQGKAAALLRERFLLWPGEPDSGEDLYEAGDRCYDAAQSIEATVQHQYYTQCFDIWIRMQDGELREIVLEDDDGNETRLPLNGLKPGSKTQLEQRLEVVKGWCYQNFGMYEPPEKLREQYAFPDGWDPKKIK
jgi:hypothetical protein